MDLSPSPNCLSFSKTFKVAKNTLSSLEYLHARAKTGSFKSLRGLGDLLYSSAYSPEHIILLIENESRKVNPGHKGEYISVRKKTGFLDNLSKTIDILPIFF